MEHLSSVEALHLPAVNDDYGDTGAQHERKVRKHSIVLHDNLLEDGEDDLESEGRRQDETG